MTSCIGWFLDISIENEYAILWIKAEDRQILKLWDSYYPGFYILPRNEPDGLYLFQILSRQQQDIIVKKVSWEENKFTSLFDNEQAAKNNRRLIYIQLQSLKYYRLLLKKLEKDYRVKQLFNTDLSHVQQYLFTKLRIEPTSKVKIEYEGTKMIRMTKVDGDDDDNNNDEQEVSPIPFSLLYFDLYTNSGILALDDAIRLDYGML